MGPTSGCSDQATHKEGVYDCNGARLHAGRPVGTGLVRLSDFVMREKVVLATKYPAATCVQTFERRGWNESIDAWLAEMGLQALRHVQRSLRATYWENQAWGQGTVRKVVAVDEAGSIAYYEQGTRKNRHSAVAALATTGAGWQRTN